MENLKYPSVKTNSRIPELFEYEESQLPKLLQYYYEWLESDGNVDFENRRLNDYKDIDYRKDSYKKFDEFLRKEFLSSLPTNLKVDERTLIKNIKNFYKAKGTEESVRILFKILFDEEAEVSYPGKYILKASDGKWLVETSLKVVLFEEISNSAEQLLLVGDTSNAVARIERTIQYSEEGIFVTEIFLKDIIGNYIEGETIFNKEDGRIIGRIKENGIIRGRGRYLNTDGFLSSDMKLQDNYYYQEYSYVIRSPRSSVFYEKIVKDLVHPTGTMMFGDVLIQQEIENYNIGEVFYNFTVKKIEYPVDLFQYIQLVVDASSDEIGSTNARYVYEFILNAFNETNIYYGYNGIGYTTTVQDNRVVTVSLEVYNDLNPNDEIEISNSDRNFFTSVKNKLSANRIELMSNFPYVNDSNLKVRKLQKNDCQVELNLLRNYKSSFDLVNIRDFNSYEENKDYRLNQVKSFKLRSLKDAILVETEGTKDILGNVRDRGIVSFDDGINSKENYFIGEILNSKTLEITTPYKYGKVSNIKMDTYNV